MTVTTGVSAVTVFFQGLLSFFSPCVLPLLPLYIGYLSGGAVQQGPDGSLRYPRKKVLLNTLFFVIGISAAFFLLGASFTALGRVLSGQSVWFSRLCGVLIILFGLYQIGVLGQPALLSGEHRLPVTLNRLAINPLTALVMGFTFSFAWTPCVGPVLSSVLLMAGSASTAGAGFALIGAYTLGFVLPFMLTGLFAGTLLELFRRHQNVVRYTVKIGGVILILMGLLLLTGWMNRVTSYMAGLGTRTESSQSVPAASSAPQAALQEQSPAESAAPSESTAPAAVAAPDFTLTDQFGNTHTLSDYKGKVVLLNFWASWCGPCQSEMPHIQQLYEDWEHNSGDLVVLSVANPSSEEYPRARDASLAEVTAFLQENGYSYPSAMDLSGEVFAMYGISSYPTTFMIDREGNLFGYVPGALSREMLDSIVQQTMDGQRS